MNSTETEEETLILSHARLLKTNGFMRGYIKCRLIHLWDKSFVMPDILMTSGGTRGHFYSPHFFTPNYISWFGDDGLSDNCTLGIDLLGGARVQVLFFRRDLIRRCADHSFIYKCAFKLINEKPLSAPQGLWRKRGNQFELALYHHTDSGAAKKIAYSSKLWGSLSNIQGTDKFRNVAYGYFTSIPRVKNDIHLIEMGMSDSIKGALLETNKPFDPRLAHQLELKPATTKSLDHPIRFWVDVEVIAPNHLWMHDRVGDPVHYERMSPKIFRVGIQPPHDIPLKGMMLDLKIEIRKFFDYVIVGDADTEEGLRAPFNESETVAIGKIDNAIPNGMEIIDRWQEKQNSHVFDDIDVELAELASTPADH